MSGPDLVAHPGLTQNSSEDSAASGAAEPPGWGAGNFDCSRPITFCGTVAVRKTTRALAITRSKTDELRDRAPTSPSRSSAELAPSAREPSP